jgi:L-alanine-DL-glutamate epimerase-like enolase superfamily enzyme
MNRAIPWHPYAKAAVEMACWDIAGKAANQPLYALLGGKVRDRCEIKLVCSGPDAATTAKMAEGAVKQGFTTVKLKTGFASGVASDVERVAAVRAAVGPDVRIVIDSNAGWTVPDAIRALRLMEPFDLLFAEQPVPQQDPRWMAEVRKHSVAPIAAHESLFTLWDATRAVAFGVADVWAITPSTHGGLIPARKIMAIAEANGIGCLVGSTLELGISTASLLHLGVSTTVLDGQRYPSDIIGPLYHPVDIIEETFEVKAGQIAPPEGPGLGVTLSTSALERFRIDR